MPAPGEDPQLRRTILLRWRMRTYPQPNGGRAHRVYSGPPPGLSGLLCIAETQRQSETLDRLHCWRVRARRRVDGRRIRESRHPRRHREKQVRIPEAPTEGLKIDIPIERASSRYCAALANSGVKNIGVKLG